MTILAKNRIEVELTPKQRKDLREIIWKDLESIYIEKLIEEGAIEAKKVKPVVKRVRKFA